MSNPTPPTRRDALVRVAIVYTLALAVGAAVVIGGPWPDLLPRLLAADIAATVLVYAASVGAGNTSIYDPYWSVLPMVMVVGLALLPESIHGDPERQLMLMGGILLWGTRLTVNWASGWTGIDHEDWRYTMFRKRYPTPVFEFINLFGLHGFPTVMVFAGLTGAIVAFGDPTPAGTLGWVGFSVICVGTLFELVSDLQLARHRRSGSTALLATGLWRWSRHPNYFGEVLVWWGIWLLAIDAGPEHWWTVLGPASITAMFVLVSIPMMEKRMAGRREGWEAYAARTSRLLPLPPRRHTRGAR